MGGAIVLDLRDPMEPRPLDEPQSAKAAGLEYVNIPVTPATHDDADPREKCSAYCAGPELGRSSCTAAAAIEWAAR